MPRPPNTGNVTTSDYHYSDEEFAFLKAVEAWQKRTKRRFPTHTDYLKILVSLGYREASGRGTEVNAHRDLSRFILAVLARHESPLLALVGINRWQIVSEDGEPLSAEETTPYKAWKSAAERVKVPI